MAQLYGAQSVMVLPADLPLIDRECLQGFIKAAGFPPVVVIAPDRRMDGTNALYICPGGLIDYQFGPGSFQRHTRQAAGYRVRVEVCHDQRLALDLDLPEDLELLQQLEVDMSGEPILSGGNCG
jgi:2-phospho-L-lactate guanylyltransferase (CobY/MobA/RfbA family)